jgi:long-chain acyl-CoA synthetase
MSPLPWLKVYDDHVPAHLDYPGSDLYSLVEKAFRDAPAAPAVRFLGKTLTYVQLAGHAENLAAHLFRYGIVPGDRVVLLLPNCPQFVIAWLALSRLGATAVLSDPVSVERELLQQWRDAEAKAVIALDLLSQRIAGLGPSFRPEFIVYTSLARFLPPRLKAIYPLKRRLDPTMPAVKIPRDGPTFRFKDCLKRIGPCPRTDVDPDFPAVLIYIGGATGGPRGIMLSHRALAVNARQTGAWAGLGPADLTLAVLPWCHGFGLSLGLITPLLHGSGVLVLPRFDARGLVKAVADDQPTLLAGTPTMFQAVASLPDLEKYDLSSLRGIFVGGAPLPAAVAAAFERRTGRRLIEGYGLTEAVAAVAGHPLGGPPRPGTVGIPFPDVTWRIVDLESGTKDLPPGQAGEIVVRTPGLMTGYWRRPEDTARTIRDGWLYTGDVGVMDEDGYVTIVDRIKDLVKISGQNVFPAEIDDVLHQHPLVAEAVAVGLPDPIQGEYLKAYVVPRPGRDLDPEDVLAFCRRNLAPYKVPREVVIRDQLPRGLVGKVLRRALRDEVA